MAPIVLDEKRSVKKAICACAAICGMLMVSGVLEGGASGVTIEGVGFGLGAAVFSAALVLSNKKLGNVPVFERSVVQLGYATVAAFPFVLLNNFGRALSFDVLSVCLVLLLGVVHTGFAYCLYFGGLSGLNAQTAAVLGYVEPVVAVFVSTFILGEPLSVLGWAGAILIVGAAVTSEIVE